MDIKPRVSSLRKVHFTCSSTLRQVPADFQLPPAMVHVFLIAQERKLVRGRTRFDVCQRGLRPLPMVLSQASLSGLKLLLPEQHGCVRCSKVSGLRLLASEEVNKWLWQRAEPGRSFYFKVKSISVLWGCIELPGTCSSAHCVLFCVLAIRWQCLNPNRFAPSSLVSWCAPLTEPDTLKALTSR